MLIAVLLRVSLGVLCALCVIMFEMLSVVVMLSVIIAFMVSVIGLNVVAPLFSLKFVSRATVNRGKWH